MHRPAFRLCRFAAHCTPSAPLRSHSSKAASLSSLVIPRLSSSSPVKSKLYTATHTRSRAALSKQQLRSCSYQRAMCQKGLETSGSSIDVTKGREVLPTNVRPVHYDLTLEPDFEKFSYAGTVIIEYVQQDQFRLTSLSPCLRLSKPSSPPRCVMANEDSAVSMSRKSPARYLLIH